MHDAPPDPTEFDLIRRIRQRAAGREDVVLGIGDDAAILDTVPGRQLVVAMDTLNAGVHFPLDTAPADIGWKALAVNLSDLAAMGAEPAWCTLSLSLPERDGPWLDGFLDGFLALAAAHGVALVGGDTTRGPLSVCVTAHGWVAPGTALRRSAACVGDDVWVSGSLGDAAAGLRFALARGEPVERDERSRDAVRGLRERLDRPTPRVALGRALAGRVHAAIDVSDGLLADLDHVCEASGVGMRVWAGALPCSPALSQAVEADLRRALQLGGGDDYELCFTAPAAQRDALGELSLALAVPLSRIGTVGVGERVRVIDAGLDQDGPEWVPPRRGYVHFDPDTDPAPGPGTRND